MGKEDEHLRLFLKQHNLEGIGSIGFGLGNKLELTKGFKPFDAVYSIDENEWNGKVSLQLRLRDIQLSNG
jgi:single-stranded-DNA-specific exonuclease